MTISFWDYAGLGRPQWRGESSLAKALYFLVLGAPDAHARIRNAHVLNLIEELPLPPQVEGLELGSARGLSLFWLARHHPQWQLLGVDLEEEWVTISERAARRGKYDNLAFRHGAAEDLENKGMYDLILCVDALEHIPDDYGLLVKIREALTPQGCLVIHVPRRRFDQWRLISAFQGYTVDGHVGEEYREGELRQLMERAGFRILTFQQTFGRWGEIAFELNMLAWRRWKLRNLLALLTYPLALPLGYVDVTRPPVWGNSFLVAAQPVNSEAKS
jgi:SAM-dependent methyltransferase